jgi:hypothetical protein
LASEALLGDMKVSVGTADTSIDVHRGVVHKERHGGRAGGRAGVPPPRGAGPAPPPPPGGVAGAR